jgi:hydroxymethylbilane synthase
MRLGTRASALALVQAKLVAQLLQVGGGDAPAVVEIVPIVTRGDRESAEAAQPPAGEDKSRWVSELEAALLAGEIDVAVHSAKDVPGEPVDGLSLVAAPPRAAAEDALCGASGLDALASGAPVGTSSLRRAAQLLAVRPDLRLIELRGNVDTRLARLQGGEVNAIVLARAGLQRLEREDAAGAVLDAAQFVPAPGQGTLALQARSDDDQMRDALTAIGSADSLACLTAERAVASALGASCDTPLGAHATIHGGDLRLRAWVGLPDGSTWVADELQGGVADATKLGQEVAARLQHVGASEILRRAGEMVRDALEQAP